MFADGHHIKYANDYELHHKDKSRDELQEFYLSSLSRKLFTADEMETVSDYQDKQAKEYYIRNYYGLRRDHISMFFCGPDKEREKLRRKTEKMIFSPVFLAFYDKKDADFIEEKRFRLAQKNCLPCLKRQNPKATTRNTGKTHFSARCLITNTV